MDIKDLMIGDWVKVNGKIVKVTDVFADGIGYNLQIGPVIYEITVKIDNIHPIPITPKILKKNGFKKRDMYYVLKVKEGFELMYYPYLGAFRYEYRGKELLFKSLNGINYVHLLQHILRLCAIEKEIEL